ncbi:MAG: chloride channel protein [Victivallaceae bacterium]|nr:chloride channel protein [Victivallaceae bacterium]
MRDFFFLTHRRLTLTASRLRRKCGDRSLMIFLSIMIGIAAALAAAALHTLVDKLEKIGIWFDSSPELWHGRFNWVGIVIFVPFLGLLFSFLFQKFFTGPRYAKSLSPLILALHRRKTWIQFREIFTHLISSALAVGAGGSAGLEAPSVLSGAAIGSTSGALFKIDQRHKMLLIGCGAAAAISAIFNSPIGGVLFAVEVLLPHFSVGALVPMLMASAVATVVSRIIFPSGGVPMVAAAQMWRVSAVPWYFALGGITALVGVYVIKSNYALSGFLRKKFPSAWQRLFVGGLLLCVLLTIFPPLRGQGYRFISLAFDGNTDRLIASAPLLDDLPATWRLAILLLAAVFLKSVTSVLTVDSGGDGGIFAPSMFIGAFTGFSFAHIVNLTGIVSLNEANFLVVGMCGVFTSVMRAPLTGVFLIAEVCGGYTLLVPLMIVSSVAWFVSRKLEPHSIYRKVLVENHLISDDPDRAMLQRLPVRLNLDVRAVHLSPEMNFSEASQVISSAPKMLAYPVVDANGHLLGTIRRQTVTGALLDPDVAENLVVFDLMKKVRSSVLIDDDLACAMEKMEKYQFEFLPVIDEENIFRGFVFRNEIFEQYRKLVREAQFFT